MIQGVYSPVKYLAEVVPEMNWTKEVDCLMMGFVRVSVMNFFICFYQRDKEKRDIWNISSKLAIVAVAVNAVHHTPSGILLPSLGILV